MKLSSEVSYCSECVAQVTLRLARWNCGKYIRERKSRQAILLLCPEVNWFPHNLCFGFHLAFFFFFCSCSPSASIWPSHLGVGLVAERNKAIISIKMLEENEQDTYAERTDSKMSRVFLKERKQTQNDWTTP